MEASQSNSAYSFKQILIILSSNSFPPEFYEMMMVSFFAPAVLVRNMLFQTHLKKHFQGQEAKAIAQTDSESEGNQSCIDSDTEVDNDDTVAVVLDTELTTPLSTAQEIVKETYCTRDYRTAVLSAIDALSQPYEDQEKKLLIAELGGLKPVAYIDHQGKKYSLLAASKVIDSLTSQKKEKRPSFLAITPKKGNHPREEIGGL